LENNTPPSQRTRFLLAGLAILLLVAAAVVISFLRRPAAAPSPPAAQSAPLEQPVTALPLAGPASQSNAEISGMAWYGETLVLLPQYPSRFGNAVFGLPKSAILAFLAGDSTAPLEPVEIPLVTSDLESRSKTSKAEAIAFAGDQAWPSRPARARCWATL
jgi:hypothetical protein